LGGRARSGRLSADEERYAPRLARLIVVTVLCLFAVAQMMQQFNEQSQSTGLQVALDLPAISVLLAVALSVTLTDIERWPWWARLPTLVIAGLFTYLPVIVLGTVWADMAGYYAGSAVILLSGWAGWTLFAGTIGSMVLIPLLLQVNLYDTAYLACSSTVLGIVIYGLARLSLLIRYADVRSSELAQFAVINERMRFARDLHDLLGYSLSAITLKAEFTRRLVIQNPGQALDELAEVLDIARQALADVRIAANGYRKMSLARQANPVSSLLAAAGIKAQIEITSEALPEDVDTVLTTVLREAVTNVLRHSTAQNCTIEAETVDETVRLRVTNDGVADSPAWDRHGSGLRNLSVRLGVIGGRLTAEIHDGWFSVLAVAPLEPPAAQRAASDANGRPRKRA